MLNPTEIVAPRFLRRARLAWILVACCAVVSWGEDAPQTLSLSQAWRLAVERSPTVRARRAMVDEVRGRALAEGTFPFNPVVEGSYARRRGEGRTSTDYEIGLSQEVELGGQRGKRRAVATAELEAAVYEARRQERLLAAHVEQAYAAAVHAREWLAIAGADRGLAQRFHSYVQRRFDAGAASQIDLNLAAAAAGRAQAGWSRARASALAARSALAEIVGLDPAHPPETNAALQRPAAGPAERDLDELIASARERRADLAALRSARDAAEARWRLARAEAYPSIEIGAFYGREESRDTLAGARVSLALPLFNRNQGGIDEAQARRERTSAEADAQALSVEREVVAAWAGLRASQEAAAQLRDGVVGTLQENLQLLERAFQAGKISGTELLLSRRELVEARRELVNAGYDAWTARITLDLAAGRLPEAWPAEEMER